MGSAAWPPAEEARKAAEDFLEQIDADPEWRRLYQEVATHAARHDAFRAEFAARQRALRERMAAVFEVFMHGLMAMTEQG